MAQEYSPSAADLEKVERANASGKQPVVFVHGLWLLDSSWDHTGRSPSTVAGRKSPRPAWTSSGASSSRNSQISLLRLTIPLRKKVP